MTAEMEALFAYRRRVRADMEECDRVIEDAHVRLGWALVKAGRDELPMEADRSDVRATSTAETTVSTRWLAALCQAAIDGELT